MTLPDKGFLDLPPQRLQYRMGRGPTRRATRSRASSTGSCVTITKATSALTPGLRPNAL